MEKRIGRPPTGRTPNVSIRLEKEALQIANERARASRKVLGEWLAEAIREKAERENSDNGN